MAQNIFNSVQMRKPPRNTFDLSHDVKFSLDMGWLVPVMCLECVPGDKMKISHESLLRFLPLIAPVLHRMNVSIHTFFVPNRIVWESWPKWITQDPTAPAFPFITSDPNLYATDLPYTKLMDYFGIPSGADLDEMFPEKLNAIPFAAYQCIYNEYYRDQNLIGEIDYKLSFGSQDNQRYDQLTTLRKRAWMHDYFTSALPWAQKGAVVEIPLITEFQDMPVFRNDASPLAETSSFTGSTWPQTIERQPSDNDDITLSRLYAKTSDLVAQSTTINDFRKAIRLQEWLEKNASGGTRYTENIYAHFAVKSSDARLQRPEYITGTKSPVVISEVLNTTGEETGLPQGNMAGHGISVTRGGRGSYFCEEHGYIISIMSVMPLPAYQQGIPKHFTKHVDQFQYYWPSFAHLGEQPIEQREIYAYQENQGTTFGYTPRYAEYKYQPSRVAGDLRTTLNYWHLGRIFSSAPALNTTFIECTPGKRIFAIEDENQDSLVCHVLNKVYATRLMPKYGTPTL